MQINGANLIISTTQAIWRITSNYANHWLANNNKMTLSKKATTSILWEERLCMLAVFAPDLLLFSFLFPRRQEIDAAFCTHLGAASGNSCQILPDPNYANAPP